ncbi:peptidylprolyl isomerase [Psychroflexus planctonicus]|uniref:Periplasmic chaperone PpiD n=1 Tax=Psychroflexus planctonicus TaxID=1526575 RepID=A0ABQ1SGW5_9FLAO|nr:peptidylprolyl isomerase [Psychroflexus planctonicus]GGE34516.1 peptidylprolyl isomerase [Psychroflexus planctonicus]
MAILSKIRQRTVVLIAVIALALFSFVLADVIKQGGFSGEKTTTNVGVIGEEKIEQEAFARQVENYRNQLGANGSTMRAVNQVWDAQVNQTILKQEFEKLGLQASRAQILDYLEDQLAGNPTFSNDEGLFSESKMVEYVANIQETKPQEYIAWQNYLDEIEVQILTDSYYNLIQAGLNVTLFEAERIYKLNNDNLNLEFAYIAYEEAEDVDISKSDIKSYINKNKERFKQDAKADIEYVLFEELPSNEDDAKVKSDIQALITEFKTTEDTEDFVNLNSDSPYKADFQFEYDLKKDFSQQLYNLNIGEVYGPYKDANAWKLSKLIETKTIADSADVKHILVTFEGARVDPEVTRSKEEAEMLADSLLSELQSDKNKYEEFAEAFSSDKLSGAKGGELGTLKFGRLFGGDKDFNEKVFTAKNESIQVIESDFGYHVVHVENLTEPKKAVKLTTLTREVQPSEVTTTTIYREASNFLLDTREKDFDELATEYGVNIKPINGIKKLEERITGLGVQRPIVKWAFEKENQVGDTELFEISQGYVVAKLVSRNEKGLQSVEQASAVVTPILKKEKQAENIMKQVSSNSLEDFTAQFGVDKKRATAVNLESPMLTGVGEEPAVVGAAFGLEVGNTSAPVKGEKGVFMVKLLQRNEASELPSYSGIAKQETEERLKNIRGQNSKLLKALKETREIEDNRSRFY